MSQPQFIYNNDVSSNFFFNNFKALKMIRKVKYRDQPQKEIKKQLNPLFLILKTEFFNKILYTI